MTKAMKWTEVGRRQTERRTAKGHVVYIHPKGRFYTVEFQLANGAIRETYTNR